MHAEAEINASKHPTWEKEQQAKLLGQKLWALIPSLLHTPDGALGQDKHSSDKKFDTVEVVRKRLQKAEVGMWTELYRDLAEAQARQAADMHFDNVAAQLGDEGGEEWTFAKVSNK
eukprot:24571-Karenia_brevis.AAC.1